MCTQTLPNKTEHGLCKAERSLTAGRLRSVGLLVFREILPGDFLLGHTKTFTETLQLRLF